MKKKINIAIDGYSSCGKSTIAQAVAKEFNYIYIDTGAMYRAVTLHALKRGYITPEGLDEEALIKDLDNVYITFQYNPITYKSETCLNGSVVEKEIREMQVSNNVSPVSAVKEVRAKLVKLQKRLAENKGVVMDGRDIGTVVMPTADLKIFMVATPEVRIQRRYDELISKGVAVSKDEIKKNILGRDHIDSNRKADPLRQATDALVLDNSELSLDEQFEFIAKKVKELTENNAPVSEVG
ncbi:MAG: (d)CMP kinase [Flavobacteriales bacterium]